MGSEKLWSTQVPRLSPMALAKTRKLLRLKIWTPSRPPLLHSSLYALRHHGVDLIMYPRSSSSTSSFSLSHQWRQLWFKWNLLTRCLWQKVSNQVIHTICQEWHQIHKLSKVRVQVQMTRCMTPTFCQWPSMLTLPSLVLTTKTWDWQSISMIVSWQWMFSMLIPFSCMEHAKSHCLSCWDRAEAPSSEPRSARCATLTVGSLAEPFNWLWQTLATLHLLSFKRVNQQPMN